MMILIANFVVKKNLMFNINESNRIVMSQHPTDMRKGVNCLCGQVHQDGLGPTTGMFIFSLDAHGK